jgi:hypothetical protein
MSKAIGRDPLYWAAQRIISKWKRWQLDSLRSSRATTGHLGNQAANFNVGCNPTREANTNNMSALKSRQVPFISADTRG